MLLMDDNFREELPEPCFGFLKPSKCRVAGALQPLQEGQQCESSDCLKVCSVQPTDQTQASWLDGITRKLVS